MNDSLSAISKDLREVAKNMTREEAVLLVRTYYRVQKLRIQSGNQEKSLKKAELPHALSEWFTENTEVLEKYLTKLLDHYSMAHPVGKWARGILGIGPVIAAGLIANVDPSKKSAGAIWRYAGLVPGQKRKRGEKIDWNPDMKQIAYFIGESFARLVNHPNSTYAAVYKKRKSYESMKNENLEYKTQADALLETKRFSETTEAFEHLKGGKLPPFLIDKRARRYAAKLFLAHFFEQSYRNHYGEEPPLPYPIAFMGHEKSSYIPAPVSEVPNS